MSTHSREPTPTPDAPLCFEERADPRGDWELYAHACGQPSLCIRELPAFDEDARLGAKALLELLVAARRGGSLREGEAGVWRVPTPMFDIPVRLAMLTDSVVELRRRRGHDVMVVRDADARGGWPRRAMGLALTALAVEEVPSSPRLAQRGLASAVRLYPGDPRDPDDGRVPYGNHNNHLAWGALSRLAAADADHARADALLREHLVRSHAAQVDAIGDRLSAIEGRAVTRSQLREELGEVIWLTLHAFDVASQRTRVRPGLVPVRSPILTMGRRGRAAQQLLVIPEAWTPLYYTGPARERLTDGDALDLACAAIAAHDDDVAPLARLTLAMPLYDPGGRAEQVESRALYPPGLQLWSSVLAVVAHWTAAGLTDAEIRACLGLDRAPALRSTGHARWRAFLIRLTSPGALP